MSRAKQAAVCHVVSFDIAQDRLCRDIYGYACFDVETFDLLTARSLSLGLPVDLAASPGRSVLHFGRNDRLLGTRLRLRIAKRLQCCDAGRSTYNLVRPCSLECERH